MNKNPLVYLPVEFGAREFDSKALLAVELAGRGYGVVIGLQLSLYFCLKYLPPGAFLFKSFNSFHHPALRVGRKYHHKVALLEEELLAHTEKKAIGNFCTEKVFEFADEIYANGEFEKQALREFSGGKVPIHVTGNGRIDLLKPSSRPFFSRDIDAIRQRFGEFILVNTNFGVTNSQWGAERVKEIHIECGFVKPEDPESLRAWEDQVEFEHLNKEALFVAIKELKRRRREQKVVIRPHPNEELSRWSGAFDDFPDVSIVREGSHVPWTMASRMLLHTSCTTGFEAYVAEKTAMSLVAKPNWISQSFISNRLNPVFTNPFEMVDAVDAYLERGVAPKGQMSDAEAEHYVWNIAGNSAVKRVADLITHGLDTPKGLIPLPRFPALPIDQTVREKFGLTFQDCSSVIQRLIPIVGVKRKLNFDILGDKVFYLSPAP